MKENSGSKNENRRKIFFTITGSIVSITFVLLGTIGCRNYINVTKETSITEEITEENTEENTDNIVFEKDSFTEEDETKKTESKTDVGKITEGGTEILKDKEETIPSKTTETEFAVETKKAEVENKVSGNVGVSQTLPAETKPEETTPPIEEIENVKETKTADPTDSAHVHLWWQEIRTVNHPAETTTVNHPAETQTVTHPAQTHTEWVEEVGHTVKKVYCSHCNAIMAETGKPGTVDDYKNAHPECQGQGYRTNLVWIIDVPEHEETVMGEPWTETVVIDAWTETIVTKEAWTEDIITYFCPLCGAETDQLD